MSIKVVPVVQGALILTFDRERVEGLGEGAAVPPVRVPRRELQHGDAVGGARPVPAAVVARDGAASRPPAKGDAALFLACRMFQNLMDFV